MAFLKKKKKKKVNLFEKTLQKELNMDLTSGSYIW